jgi:H+/Cl- antiporter ClcA
LLKKSLKILFFSITIGILTGICCIAFSKTLEFATSFRKEYGAIPFMFLPMIGFLVTSFYMKFGIFEDHGNELLLEELHRPQKKIRFRLIPLIFCSAILSHLFGASVGREGVGVQMGTGIADQFPHQFIDRKLLLMMGMSAGFSAIFGAPIAGAIFGIEVLFIGKLNYKAFLPCLMSAIVGFLVAKQFGGRSGVYFTIPSYHYEIISFIKVGILGVLIGLVARLFTFTLHETRNFFNNKIYSRPIQTFVGGLILILLYYLAGSDRYHGLGEELIFDAANGKSYNFDSIFKIISTCISYGSGFKGGEVMPMFIVGATAASAFNKLLLLLNPLAVALGFVALFAGAANTPIAAILLASEFFGPEILPYATIAVFMSFTFSGKHGIFKKQKKNYKKYYFNRILKKV